MSRSCWLVVWSLMVCGAAAGDDFVPFVIPAKPNPESLIAVKSYAPIETRSERLTVGSGHFYRGDERIRLWGVNLSFNANFPRKEDAPYVAARLAAAGVNAVRCHHMDTARWPRGLWNAEDGKNITPEALDRLDYFIDQLARHGILVNINLHVGRQHSQYLDLAKSNREYDKICSIFTPALIDAQKQFARELLTHVNSYRSVRYADDPAVALVEITNENSLFMWGSEDALRTLPPYYAEILQRKFNDWLKNSYGSNDRLRQTWAEGAESLGQNILTNGNFQTTAAGPGAAPQNWRLEQHADCKASLSQQRRQSKEAIRIEISKADDTEWHLQLTQGGFAVKAGQYYTVSFESAGDKPRSISCSIGQAHSPWDNLGLSRRAELAENWQSFRYGFVAKTSDADTRISFSFGASDIPVYFANVELRPGGRIGLAESESAEAGSVTLFADSESPARTLDRLRFLAQTEKGYFDDMRNFIKKDLGCKALVTGTIVFGPLGLYAQSDMDFVDAHAYWQHPRFPGRPWDAENWIVEQKAMTDYPDEATLSHIAANRLAGKPFTLTEYNHPAPMDSQAQCVPMIASFAAAQDWDGVWLYTYSHSSDNWDRQTMNGYFDIDTNPAKWGFMRAGTAIFRHEAVAPLSDSVLVPIADSPDILTSLAEARVKHGDSMFAVLSARIGAIKENMVSSRIIPDLGKKTLRRISHPADWPGKLEWSVENGKGFYSVCGRGASVYTGHAERFEKATGGKISIASPTLVSLTMTTLDETALDRSHKILITAAGRCENVGMKFSNDRRTVGRDWGGPPVQIEAATGKIILPKGQWKCHALGPDGVPTGEVPVSSHNGQAVLTISPQYRTMWYLLTAEPETKLKKAQG